MSTNLKNDLILKEDRLRRVLAEGGASLLAYSGGVDSAYLAVVAREVLGDRFAAVIADSASLPDWELEEALDFAREQQIPVRKIETQELDRQEYRANGKDRCYHCKVELFDNMKRLAAEEGFSTLLYGGNVSDRADLRPGADAARHFAVRAPLEEAGLSKDDIRALARARALPLWDKPARPCLASRIPHFSEVTVEKLRQVAGAEKILRDLGFREYRVRHHGPIARLELAGREWDRLVDPRLREQVSTGLAALGFQWTVTDLEEFSSGRLSRLAAEESGEPSDVSSKQLQDMER